MIGPSKRKILKKEMKKDPLIVYYFKARELMLEYQKQILIGLGGVAVIAILIFVMISRNSSQEEKANVEIGKIISVYNSGAYKQAIDGMPQKNIKGLKFIVSEFGSTEAGENAKILLANAYLNLGDYKSAMEYYDDYSGSNKLLKAASYVGVASCYENDKKYEDAADYYLKAANVSKDEAKSPEYLVAAARLFNQVDKKDKARKLVDQLKTEYPKSSQAREIERYELEFQL